MVLLAYRHGLHASELCDLRWDQVDFNRAVLHVRRVKQGTPATHPLTGLEMRALRKLQRESEASVRTNLCRLERLDLLLAPAENAVEAGLYAVWERLSDGRLFVFSSLQNWLSEFRIYRRDEKGKIVKQNDHLMDATRYLILSGLQVACREPREEEEDNRQWIDGTRNEYTGY